MKLKLFYNSNSINAPSPNKTAYVSLEVKGKQQLCTYKNICMNRSEEANAITIRRFGAGGRSEGDWWKNCDY